MDDARYPPPSDPVYSVRDARRPRGDGFELRVGRLEVRRGEVLCLLGPTGSGKTTLLRLLAGLDRPASGDIRFLDRSLSEGEAPLALRRRMTMLFQRPLLQRGTVRRNVAQPLRWRGGEETAAVDALLEELELAPLADRSADALSGGQAQLVALARTLVPRPDAVLLDEPSAGLDPGRTARVEATVRAMRRDRRTAFVWATHDLFQARRVADRIAFLHGGELVETGARDAILDRPTDPRTAAFLRGELLP